MSVQTILLALAVIAFGGVQYTLVYQGIRDLMRRPRVRGGNKTSWALLILCVPVGGALAYGWLGPTSFRQSRAVLRDAGGTGRPVVLIPSLINPPSILDLGPGRSLARWLSERGMRALLLDWGTPAPAEQDMGLLEHVEAQGRVSLR